MPETPTQSPNPIQLFKQQYPGYANTPDVHVYNFLANPANFKRAFPGYAQTPDSQIQGFMQKFIPADYSKATAQFTGPLPAGIPKPQETAKPESLLTKAEGLAEKFLKPLQTPIPGAGWGVPGLYLPAKALAALGQAVPKTASPKERLAAGAAQAPKAMIEAFTTPENAITLSGFLVLPEGAVAKTLGGLFTAQQAAQTFSQFKEGLAAWRNGDYEKAGTLLASAPMSALFTALGAAKLAGDLTKAREVPEPTEKSVKGEVLSKEPLAPAPVEQVEINKPLVTKVAREAPKPQTPTQKVEAIRQEMQSKAVASTTKPSQTVPASLEQQKNTYRQFLTNPELVNRAVQMPNGELAVPTGGERTQGKLDFIDSKNWKQQQTESIQFLKGRPGFENVRAGGYNGRSVVWGLDTNEGGKPGYKTPGEINRSQWQTTQVAPASQVRPTPVPRPQPTPTPLTPEALARFNAIKSASAVPATPVASPVRTSQFYPDAKAAQQLAQFDQPVPEMIQNSKIQQKQTELGNLDHSLYGVGSGRVPELADNQRRFLEQRRVKVQRELKDLIYQHVRTLTPQQQAQKLIEYGNRANSNGKIGSALLAASKMQENPPEWLMEYAKELRSNNPTLRKRTLQIAMQKMRPGAITEEDQKGLDLVDNYLNTLYEAETLRGQSIPLSMTQAHLRDRGNRALRQAKRDREIFNAIKYRIGVKREKAAIGKAPEEAAPKVAEPIAPAPEPKPIYKVAETAIVKADIREVRPATSKPLPQTTEGFLKWVQQQNTKMAGDLVEERRAYRAAFANWLASGGVSTEPKPKGLGPDLAELDRSTVEKMARGMGVYVPKTIELKPSEPLKTIPVLAPKEEQAPLETVEPTAAEAPVHIEGGALSLEQLEEKGFEAQAETLSPEEELLKGERESEQERKYAALAKNLERSSLRDAFKADMLKAVKADGGDVEKADQAIDMMPLDKMLTAPWKKHTRGVIERYAQAAQPSTVKRTIEITPTQNLSETSKQWLSAIDALEDHFVHSGEYDAIRRAVPSHFTPEKKLERYATALQKYIEWDEDQDPKALRKAVGLASKDPEKGAVSLGKEKLDPLVILKKAQKLGIDASFTASSPLYEAGWVIGTDPLTQIQLKVGTWDSHMAVANQIEGYQPPKDIGKLSGAAYNAALKRANEAMNKWLATGEAFRVASPNSIHVGRLEPKSLQAVWDLFKRNVYKLRQTQEDPALFIESLYNLKGEPSDDMEVPLTYNYIQDQHGGDIVKAVASYLGRYHKSKDTYLYSGPPIEHGLDYIKQAMNWVSNWANAELNGGRVPSTFLQSKTLKAEAHAQLRETLGELNRASAILQNQTDTYREWWNALPLEARQEKFWDFMAAVETGKKLDDPYLQEQADLGRALEDDRFNQLSVLGKAPHYIENYWYHLWDNSKKAKNFAQNWTKGKRPMQGPAKFKRQRLHPTYADGKAAGLIPKSYNPIEVLLQSLNSKDRYIHFNRMANFWKAQGIMKFARTPSKLPPLEMGWGHIEDPMMEPKFRTKEGLVTPGKWYVPKPFADIVNNYLHPGWDNHLAYRGARAYINRINMTTLGLSAFHIMTTAYNSMAIDGAYGLQSLLDAAKYRDPNRLKLATLAFIRGMVPGASLIDNMLKGAHVYDTWLHPEQAKAIHEQITQVGVKANLPFKWERYYFQDDTAKFWQAWHDASLKHPWSYSKVAWHGLFAPFEALSKPIFNYIVPLGKLGALAKLAERELYLESKQDPRLVNPESKMLRGTAIADRLDDAFGEVEYDNFRMSWWAKSLAKLGFKSAGWSLGTGRLGEHAFSDFVKEPFRAASGYGFEVPLATGYFMALAVGMAMYNTLLQLWLTSGKGKPEFPSSLKDLMYPKDGEGGRVYPKTYITDIISFAHEPITTIWHKASPLATLFYLARNQDFMGYEITDPMASLGQNIYHVLNFGVKEGLPLSVKNWQFQATKGASLAEKAIASVGITRAPRWIINDAFQNRLDQLVEPQFAAGPKTYRERARVENMAKFRGERLAGKLTDAEVYRMVKDGTILPQDGKRLLRFSSSSAMENEFSKINLEQALWAWQKASKSEKGMFADVLAKKASQIPNWGLKEFETLEEAQKDIHSMTHQLDSALANFPFSRIEARLYIAAGQETLDYNRQYFMQQRPPHIHGMPTIQQLTGMPHPKARGPNIGVADALKRIDLQFKQAMARNDKDTAGMLQRARQSLLLSWWSQYLRDHPRAGVPSQAGEF